MSTNDQLGSVDVWFARADIRSPRIETVTHKTDFEDQIFERFGSEPSRKDSKISNIQSDGGDSNKPEVEGHRSNNILVTPEMSENSEIAPDTITADKTSERIPTKTLMIIDELPSIVGVDKNVYGPVAPQDIITIPEPNARILIKNRKGTLIQTYK